MPFLYDRHARRLRASAAHLGLDVPFSDAALLGWIDDTVAAAGEMDEAYIRVLLTRGVGELTYDVRATPSPSLVIIVKPLDEPPARVLTEGITVVARLDPAEPPGVGQPDHQVEQPAEQRAGDAGGEPARSR